jgi:hypothetical protein
MIRILRDVTFNETEMAISMNIRSLPQKTITLTTSTKSTKTTEITEIIENASNTNDTDIADTNDANTIFENIENMPFENITVEPAPVRRSIRYRKATFKAIGANTITANVIGATETPTISADEKENEEENYLSKIIIAKSIIANENKPTYEKAITDSEKFQ